MVIANPIYDVVFKRLMENERVARFFIGTLLDETIETVEVKPQEFTYTEELVGIAVFRLDFIATIKNINGEYRKVLIEIQKARNYTDLMRFRNYLAEQYKKEDIVNGEKMVLPITTIYILGFKLPEVETPCIKVERSYKDLVNQTTLTTKSEFIENLTHDSYIVQVDRITNRYQTRLDKLLSVFEQRHFVDDNKIVKEYKHDTDLEEVAIITGILHYAGTEPAERKKIETEVEAWRTINEMLDGERKAFREQLAEQRKILEDQRKVMEEQQKVMEQQQKAMGEKNKMLEETSSIREELLRQLDELKRRLNENL